MWLIIISIIFSWIVNKHYIKYKFDQNCFYRIVLRRLLLGPIRSFKSPFVCRRNGFILIYLFLVNYIFRKSFTQDINSPDQLNGFHNTVYELYDYILNSVIEKWYFLRIFRSIAFYGERLLFFSYIHFNKSHFWLNIFLGLLIFAYIIDCHF